MGPDAVPSAIDELPLLAVVATQAYGWTRLQGAEELRVKESDRIALTVAGLRALGVDAEELPDGWRITGAPVRATPSATRAVVATAADHRIAMAFTVANLAGVGTTDCDVDDLACADVSYPGFLDDLGALT